MVGVVGGAGAGLKVSGGIDTSMIERGFDRVRQSFESVKGQAKSFTSDLTRMQIESGKLVNKLSTLGIIGVSAIIGLASKAPAVAGSMAKIGVETDRLIRTLGTQFAPEFAKISELYTKFVNFVGANPDLTKGFVFSATALAGFVAAGKFVKMLGLTTVSKSLLTALAGIAKVAAIPVAALTAAAGLGSALGETVGEMIYKEGGVSEKVASYIVDRPALRSAIEGYAGIGGWIVDKVSGLFTGDNEDNRRNQLLQSDDATWG